MAMPQSQKRDLDSVEIPDRLYFKIGDVAHICNVEAYVLRFWETKFPQLKPKKSGNGQRLYRRRDVEIALKIKHLVHGEGYTLAGALQLLEQTHHGDDPGPAPQLDPPSQPPIVAASPSQPPSIQTSNSVATTINQARAELREICTLLASPQPRPLHRRARVTTMPSSTSGSLFPTY
jgi:DNA-binding transcriptional MerR regulator